MAAEDVFARIQEKLKELKLSPRAASLAAGKGPDAIRNLQRAVQEGKDFDFRSGTIEALASVLQTTPEWLLQGRGSEIAPHSQIRPTKDRGDMPIFATSSIDDDRFEISDYVVSRIPRPSILEDVDTAYGIIVETSSMSPAYEIGDALLINPMIGSRQERDALVRLSTGGLSRNVGVIRRLIRGQGPKSTKFRRFNPDCFDDEKAFYDQNPGWHLIVARLIDFM